MEARKEQKYIPVPTEYFFHEIIPIFLNKGINLVIDHILLIHSEIALIVKKLSSFFVGVHSPLFICLN